MSLFGKLIGNAPGGGASIGGAISGATAGSVFFAGVGGVLAQDNTDFSYDATSKQFHTKFGTFYDGSLGLTSSGGLSAQMIIRDAGIGFTNVGTGFETLYLGSQFSTVKGGRFSADGATITPLSIKLAAAQTADAFQVYASDGTTKLAKIDSAGGIYSGDSYFYTNSGAGACVIQSGANQLRLQATNVYIRDTGTMLVDGDNTARNTRLCIYDVDNGTLERVSVGIADSGGAGYKVLRIPN